MVYLAKVYNLTKIERYKDAVLKGLDYMLAAQYPNGGWPQYYPLRKGYYTHITFNDNLTVNVMTVLQDIIERNPQFAFVDDPAVIQKCQTAFDKGLDCILKAQYRQNGVLTGWCAQHDEKTLLPTNARAFELASLSGSEGANIVLFLMTVKNPSHELKQSIKAAVEWFEKVKIEGVKITYEIDSEGRRDRVAIADPNAKTVWARFYDLETNKPIFVGRDGVKKDKLSDIEYERRNGYGYYTETPVKAIKNYKKYVEKNK
jgi:pectinesterase